MKPTGKDGRNEIARRKLLAGLATVPLMFAGAAEADDPNSRQINTNLPDAVGTPAACLVPGERETITYRTSAGELVVLIRNRRGDWSPLVSLARDPPAPVGELFAYADSIRRKRIVVYRDGNGEVRAGAESLSAVATDAPRAAGDPVGYHNAGTDAHHVIYRGADGHLHALFWTGENRVQYAGNLTRYAQPEAPKAVGQPTAFVDGGGGNHVIYRSEHNDIIGLYWKDSHTIAENLSGVAGTSRAAGEPVAIYTPHADTIQVIYLDVNDCFCELYWAGGNRVQGWNLTEASGAPQARRFTGPHRSKAAVYYSAGTNTKHVVYATQNRYSAQGRRLHEIWWTWGSGTAQHVDMTERYGLAPVEDMPAAFATESPSAQHVVYRGEQGRLYEMIW